MIKSITITNASGESLTMDLYSPEKSGFIILKIDGLGPPKADIKRVNISGNYGTEYTSSYVQERNIVFDFRFLEKLTIEDTRLESYKYFPIGSQVIIHVITENRDVVITGYIESNEPDIFSKEVSTRISVICPSTYFTSTEINYQVFYGLEPLFEFPFENNSVTEPLIEFALIKTETFGNIFYTGDVPIGLILNLFFTGPASNISIYNLTRSEVIQIDTDKVGSILGSPIQAGDSIHIDTNDDVQTIMAQRDGVRYNILNSVDKRNQWIKIQKGDNVIAYDAESGLENTQFESVNFTNYEGV